jgi:hypothetical protein
MGYVGHVTRSRSRERKGADTDIDGVEFFADLYRKEVHKIVVSVKGGGIKPDVRAQRRARRS